MLFFFVAFVLVVASFVAPAPRLVAARNGAILGRVDLRRVSNQADRRPNVADLGGAASALDISDRARSVVYLESAPRGAFETVDTTHAVMDQRGERFIPHVLAITTGTIVDFPNSDHIYHNVFSLSRAKSFDLGRYAAGRSKPVRFDRPGIVRVFCDIHSHMNAFILVFGHPFFSLTDADGRYRIDNVPPGVYNLIAWNEGTTSEARQVTVVDGAVDDEDFTLR